MLLCLKRRPVGGTVEIPTLGAVTAAKGFGHYNLWVCLSFLILELNHPHLHNATISGGLMKMRGGNKEETKPRTWNEWTEFSEGLTRDEAMQDLVSQECCCFQTAPGSRSFVSCTPGSKDMVPPGTAWPGPSTPLSPCRAGSPLHLPPQGMRTESDWLGLW